MTSGLATFELISGPVFLSESVTVLEKHEINDGRGEPTSVDGVRAKKEL